MKTKIEKISACQVCGQAIEGFFAWNWKKRKWNLISVRPRNHHHIAQIEETTVK